VTRDQVFAVLRAHKLVTVTVTFSGGNDEGGADSIIGRDASNNEVDLDAAGDLADALEAPVYDKYDGFTGEFYVNGTVTWDVVNRKVTMSADEEVSHWEHEEYDI
jgi:hypothetical protein